MNQIPTFEFAAVRGAQGGRGYYLASIPFGILSRLLAIDAGNALDRSQRDVDAKRAAAVAKYITTNPQSFVIPGLTGVINAQNIGFVEHQDGSFVGTMQVPMDAEIKLFDGQHRAVGIMEAIKECHAIRGSTVPVQLFTDMTLADRQQAFSDINSNAKAVSASLNHAYNLRNTSTQALAALAKDTTFNGIIEYQRNAVSGKSPKLFSLKALIEASRMLLSVTQRDELADTDIELAKTYWSFIQYPAGWIRRFTDPTFNGETGRDELVSFHTVAMMAFARLGRMLIDAKFTDEEDLRRVIGHLSSISFKRNETRWVGVCVNEDGTMISNVAAQKAMAEAMFDHVMQEERARLETEELNAGHEGCLLPPPATIAEHMERGEMDFAIAAYITNAGHEGALSADQVAAANAHIEKMEEDQEEQTKEQREFKFVRAAMNDARAETKDGAKLLECLRAIGQLRTINYRTAKAAVKDCLGKVGV